MEIEHECEITLEKVETTTPGTYHYLASVKVADHYYGGSGKTPGEAFVSLFADPDLVLEWSEPLSQLGRHRRKAGKGARASTH